MKSMLVIHQNTEALNQAVASQVAEILIQAVRLRGSASVSLSGGSTPTGVYDQLAQPQFRDSVPWNAVHFFWGDERCVPPQDPESNYRQAFDHLLNHIPISLQNIHRIKAELSPKEAVSDYTRVLSDHAQGPNPWPIFDLALLGMGEDGHTASLFPGFFNPEEDSKPVIHVNVEYQDRPACRVTLTPLVFNTSRNVIFLVVGSAKAVALQKALSGTEDPKHLPVQRIRPASGTLIWHVDSPAATNLTTFLPRHPDGIARSSL